MPPLRRLQSPVQSRSALLLLCGYATSEGRSLNRQLGPLLLAAVVHNTRVVLRACKCRRSPTCFACPSVHPSAARAARALLPRTALHSSIATSQRFVRSLVEPVVVASGDPLSVPSLAFAVSPYSSFLSDDCRSAFLGYIPEASERADLLATQGASRPPMPGEREGGREGHSPQHSRWSIGAAPRPLSLAEKRGATRGSTLHSYGPAAPRVWLTSSEGRERGRGGRGYPGCRPCREFLIRKMCASVGRFSQTLICALDNRETEGGGRYKGHAMNEEYLEPLDTN